MLLKPIPQTMDLLFKERNIECTITDKISSGSPVILSSIPEWSGNSGGIDEDCGGDGSKQEKSTFLQI